MSAADQSLRRRILDVSIALIERDGLAALSLREVARRAGVSHQAPYHHFGDRATILAAIVAEGFVELTTRMMAAVARAKRTETKIAAAGEAYVLFALDHPAHFQLMFRPELVDLARFPEAAEAGARAFAVLRDLAALLPGDAQVHASLLWSVVHGLAQLMLDRTLPARNATRAQRHAHARAVTSALAAALA